MGKAVDNYIRTSIKVVTLPHPALVTNRKIVKVFPLAVNKEMVVYAFLDIEEEFDNMHHKSVKKALVYRGVESTTFRWMAQALSTITAET